MAQLSEFVESEDAPDNRIRARKVALEGEKTYPSSEGGRRCRDIVRRIEAPSYTLVAMASDGPARRSIEVTHENMAALHFRAYAADLIGRVETAGDYNLLPAGREVMDLVRSSRPAKAWTVPLPPTPKTASSCCGTRATNVNRAQ